jgi:hypothetical protein
LRRQRPQAYQNFFGSRKVGSQIGRQAQLLGNSKISSLTFIASSNVGAETMAIQEYLFEAWFGAGKPGNCEYRSHTRVLIPTFGGLMTIDLTLDKRQRPVFQVQIHQ